MSSLLTSSQLLKEFRPLLMPWAVSIGGALLITLLALSGQTGQFASFVADLGLYAFLGGLALQAALTFGSEFQNRTLPLLLTQPWSRGRVWSRKMAVLAASMITAILIGTLLVGLMSLPQYSPLAGGTLHNEAVAPIFATDQIVLSGIFLLATACSCCFWTLLAGSTIGGLALTATVEFLTGLVVALIVARISGRDEPFEGPHTPIIIAAASLVYCAVFLELGRRKFLRLQLREAHVGEYRPSLPGWLPRGWQPNWLTCRPTERVLNLVRKEIRLQKPLFQIAMLLVVCWLAIFVLTLILPKHGYTKLFAAAVVIYVPLCSLLAGCVPLGEEKALGVFGAQLAMPASATLQWGIKFIVGLGSALVLGEGLPWLLACGTCGFLDLDGLNPTDNFWLAIGGVSLALFLLGFWAVHMVGNTIRAALNAVIGLACAVGCVALGIWLALMGGNFQAGMLTTLMCRFQLPPDVVVWRTARVVGFAAYVIVAVVLLVMLGQTLRQFRRSQESVTTLFKNAAVLAWIICFASFWSMDLSRSADPLPISLPVDELKRALHAIVRQDPQPNRQTDRVISSKELEGRISEETTMWLRNASISYRMQQGDQFQPAWKQRFRQTICRVTITFPNGYMFGFDDGWSTDPFRRRYGTW